MEIERNNENDASIISMSNSFNTNTDGSLFLEISQGKKNKKDSKVNNANEDKSHDKKRKRRSKNDQEGRMFKCDCGRAYLSALALSNHKKSKHSNINDLLEISIKPSQHFTQGTSTLNNNPESIISPQFSYLNNSTSTHNNFNTHNNHLTHFPQFIYTENQDSPDFENNKKKRGRPKKNYDYKLSNFPEFHYKIFFDNEFRRKKENEGKIVIKDYIDKVFTDIFVNFKDKCILDIKSPTDHPLLYMLNQMFDSESNNNSNTISCDQIFIKYLEGISTQTNRDYFLFAFKFVILFRECINKYKNIELENSIILLNEQVPKHVKEFTQFYDAEQVPELCNEFLTEFLEVANFFGLRDNYVNEFIDIIQHFCFWLYQNNFTASRLSLVNNS